MEEKLKVPKAPGYLNQEQVTPPAATPEVTQGEAGVVAIGTGVPTETAPSEQVATEQVAPAPSATVQPVASAKLEQGDRPIPHTNFVQAEAMIGREQNNTEELAALGDIYNFEANQPK